ncbi:Alpha/Beta hydrolase protein [Entophlyctis helioformis]|nr:Alpha/Beta hydrolase protein [Entophlyctis helioformis]
MLALGVAYVVNILFTAICLVTAFAYIPAVRAVVPRQVSRARLALLSTLVTEFPQALLLAKVALAYYAGSCGLFALPGMAAAYWTDIALMLALWGLFLQAFFARFPIYERTKEFRDATSTDPPLFFTISFWFRLLNPLWENICYATAEELEEAGEKNKGRLSLDVYHHPSYPKNRPVLIYIHGGSYRSGSKEVRPPLLPYLALKRYVIVTVNYRLSPNVNYPTHISDVKRAIRWVRANIATYGGDASFIALAGCSSGAHLATMVALTASETKYQPGFESVDTSVQAVVAISGVYDLTNFKNHFGFNLKSWFTREVSGDQDEAFFREASPTRRLKDAETRMHLDSSSAEEKAGLQLPPFMIIHGRGDTLAPITHVREFAKTFKLVVKTPLCYIELPNANHLFYSLSTPRAHYLAYGVEPFLRFMHDKHTAARLAAASPVSSPGSASA